MAVGRHECDDHHADRRGLVDARHPPMGGPGRRRGGGNCRHPHTGRPGWSLCRARPARVGGAAGSLAALVGRWWWSVRPGSGRPASSPRDLSMRTGPGVRRCRLGAGPCRTGQRGPPSPGGGDRSLRAARCLLGSGPGGGTAARPGRPVRAARTPQAPQEWLGQPHRHRADRRPAGRRGAVQPRDRRADVHLAGHGPHPCVPHPVQARARLTRRPGRRGQPAWPLRSPAARSGPRADRAAAASRRTVVVAGRQI
jgi:hypothetical protein